MRNLQSIIEDIQNAQSAEHAFEIYNKGIQQYGYENALLTIMTDHDSLDLKAFHGIATSFPEDWVRYYKSTGSHEFDPVFQGILKGKPPFFWSDIEKLWAQSKINSDQQKRAGFSLMRDAEDAGVADGIGISFQNEFGEISGLGISRKTNISEKNYGALADLYVLSSAFHEKYFSYYKQREFPKITTREREVLLWASSGKTDDEIADELNIARPTVRFHWKNIFEKLRVANKLAATVRAVQMKIIIPQSLKMDALPVNASRAQSNG